MHLLRVVHLWGYVKHGPYLITAAGFTRKRAEGKDRVARHDTAHGVHDMVESEGVIWDIGCILREVRA